MQAEYSSWFLIIVIVCRTRPSSIQVDIRAVESRWRVSVCAAWCNANTLHNHIKSSEQERNHNQQIKWLRWWWWWLFVWIENYHRRNWMCEMIKNVLTCGVLCVCRVGALRWVDWCWCNGTMIRTCAATNNNLFDVKRWANAINYNHFNVFDKYVVLLSETLRPFWYSPL